MYQDLRDRNQVFSAMMCRYRLGMAVAVDSQTEVVDGELASGNYFPMLGVKPAAGRLFTAADDLRAGAHPVAVISYGWWQTRFAGDPHVIGRAIRVNNFPLTIVGVAQPGFDEHGARTARTCLRARDHGCRRPAGVHQHL